MSLFQFCRDTSSANTKMMILNYSIVFLLFAIFSPNDGKSVPPSNSSIGIDANKSAVPSPNASNSAIVEENISKFMLHYRKLRGNTSEAAMRLLVTLGLVSGALKVEDAMKVNLNRIASDMFANFNTSTPNENMHKLLRIEETMERDRTSINILESILGFARNAKNFVEFQKDMQRILKEVSFELCNFPIHKTVIRLNNHIVILKNEASVEKLRNKKNQMTTDMDVQPKKMQTAKLMQRSAKSIKYEMTERLNGVKEMIDKHTNRIHSSVTDSAKRTIEFVQALQEKNNILVGKKRNKSGNHPIKVNSAMASLVKIWEELKPKNASPDLSVSFEFNESNEEDAGVRNAMTKEDVSKVSRIVKMNLNSI